MNPAASHMYIILRKHSFGCTMQGSDQGPFFHLILLMLKMTGEMCLLISDVVAHLETWSLVRSRGSSPEDVMAPLDVSFRNIWRFVGSHCDVVAHLEM